MSQIPKNNQLKEIFQKKILNWFEINNRNFLWRKSNNPYEIIIAEIMLQKTNAEKVVLTYPIFLKRYPNLHTLLIADNEELKDLLKYLGLQNQKALILKELANKVLNNYDGKIPSTKEELLSIKGIGDYIANAILCFAFNIRVPIIDGNVIRILERLFDIKSRKKNPRTDKEIWKQMEKLLPIENYRDFNYALLDFASLICKFYNPLCEDCFMIEFCNYNKNIEE